ncbi:MAG: hypothetical protein K2L72_04855, partial [Clostridia bacterium]|nr:hypothetical protein [Clostridia bacterium]
MKKTAKILTVAITALTLAVSAATAAGCKINNGNASDAPYYDTATVYAQAVELGYNGTLEEFIEMISGKDGTDGKDGANGNDGVGVKSGRLDE